MEEVALRSCHEAYNAWERDDEPREDAEDTSYEGEYED